MANHVSSIRDISIALLILFVAFGHFDDCPGECKCDQDASGHKALYCHQIPRTFNVTSLIENLTVHGGITTINGGATEFESNSVSSLVYLRNIVMDNLGLTSISNEPEVPSLEYLRTLSLNNNRLLRLTMNAFSWCANLRELRLAGNGIKQLHADIFVALRFLETLNLANNNLQTLDFHLMPSLVTLDLNNNEISRIAPIGIDLPNLLNLRLCGNQLETTSELVNMNAPKMSSLCVGDAIAAFDSNDVSANGIVQLELVGKTVLDEKLIGAVTLLTSLQLMTFSFFQVDNLTGESFAGFDELLELHLNNVKTTLDSLDIDKDTFAPLTKLRLIDLKGSSQLAISFLRAEHLQLPASVQTISLQETKLTTVDTLRNLENMTGVDLSHNPLQCDGNLRDLMKLLLRRPVILIHSNETKCASPEALRGDELLGVAVVANILLQEPQGLNASNDDAINQQSDIEDVLKTLGVSIECLFYLTAAMSLATITLLVISIVLCVYLVNGRRKKLCANKGDSMEGFVRADNEYTFDNFTLSETLAECRRLNHPLHGDSTVQRN